MNKIVLGLLLTLISQILSFIAYQGQFMSSKIKDNIWISVLISIPAVITTIYSVRYTVEGFNGLMWPSRVLSFSVGVVVFTIMSYFFFKEIPELKTLVTLLLAACIIGIQILWR